jgi:hypothetical protein
MFYGDLQTRFPRYSRRAGRHLEKVPLCANLPTPIWSPCVIAGRFCADYLPLHNLSDFISAPEATENPDLVLRNAEMLCQ